VTHIFNAPLQRSTISYSNFDQKLLRARHGGSAIRVPAHAIRRLILKGINWEEMQPSSRPWSWWTSLPYRSALRFFTSCWFWLTTLDASMHVVVTAHPTAGWTCSRYERLSLFSRSRDTC
jgi:hypothetical protein